MFTDVADGNANYRKNLANVDKIVFIINCNCKNCADTSNKFGKIWEKFLLRKRALTQIKELYDRIIPLKR